MVKSVELSVISRDKIFSLFGSDHIKKAIRLLTGPLDKNSLIYYALTVSSAKPSSIKIRPQCSQTITFLRWRMSNCLCGGIWLKQPEHESRWIETTARPFFEFLRKRL